MPNRLIWPLRAWRDVEMKAFLKYWLPVLIWLVLIFIGSTDLLSAEHTSRIVGPILRWLNPGISVETIARVQFFVRKTGHLTEYAVLAALLWRAVYVRMVGRASTSVLFVVLLIACGIFAASDEFHQSFVPSRTSSPYDVMIDVCGALISLVVCGVVARRKVLSNEDA